MIRLDPPGELARPRRESRDLAGSRHACPSSSPGALSPRLSFIPSPSPSSRTMKGQGAPSDTHIQPSLSQGSPWSRPAAERRSRLPSCLALLSDPVDRAATLAPARPPSRVIRGRDEDKGCVSRSLGAARPPGHAAAVQPPRLLSWSLPLGRFLLLPQGRPADRSLALCPSSQEGYASSAPVL
jgi:hypothetical protein